MYNLYKYCRNESREHETLLAWYKDVPDLMGIR